MGVGPGYSCPWDGHKLRRNFLGRHLWENMQQHRFVSKLREREGTVARRKQKAEATA